MNGKKLRVSLSPQEAWLVMELANERLSVPSGRSNAQLRKEQAVVSRLAWRMKEEILRAAGTTPLEPFATSGAARGEDELDELVREFIKDKPQVRMIHLWDHLVKKKVAQGNFDMASQRRLGNILRHLGFERSWGRENGQAVKTWAKVHSFVTPAPKGGKP